MCLLLLGGCGEDDVEHFQIRTPPEGYVDARIPVEFIHPTSRSRTKPIRIVLTFDEHNSNCMPRAAKNRQRYMGVSLYGNRKRYEDLNYHRSFARKYETEPYEPLSAANLRRATNAPARYDGAFLFIPTRDSPIRPARISCAEKGGKPIWLCKVTTYAPGGLVMNTIISSAALPKWQETVLCVQDHLKRWLEPE